MVGETPMVMLDRLADGLGGQVCAKLEYLNPGGSVKDRIGVAMIDAAEEAGVARAGKDGRSSSRPAATPGSRWRWSARRAATS